MRLAPLALLLCLLTACTLSAPNPTTVPTPGESPAATPDNAALPVIGVTDLQPSGVAPCIMTPISGEVPVLSAARVDAAPVAILGSGRSEVPFHFDPRGWYEFNIVQDASHTSIGWINSNLVLIQGDCAFLFPPKVCSVKSAIGANVNVYAQPHRDAAIISVLGKLYTIPLIEQAADGWFKVNIGEGQSGWIAPDEGQEVGC